MYNQNYDTFEKYIKTLITSFNQMGITMSYIISFLGVIVRGFIAIVLAIPCFYTVIIPDMVESMNTFSFLVPLSIILNFFA